MCRAQAIPLGNGSEVFGKVKSYLIGVPSCTISLITRNSHAYMCASVVFYLCWLLVRHRSHKVLLHHQSLSVSAGGRVAAAHQTQTERQRRAALWHLPICRPVRQTCANSAMWKTRRIARETG